MAIEAAGHSVINCNRPASFHYYRIELPLALQFVIKPTKSIRARSCHKKFQNHEPQATDEMDTIGHAVERLLKLRPSKKKKLVNSIKSMFQFQSGISEADIDTFIHELQKRKHIKIEQNRISYL
ncbi:hypothetical protein [Methylicorpusculum sp.]|uniref:hypothetical protein n=1 Tax=Methylicorpusculum sp. TaxID=2713644 RepID=UPI00271D6AC4|nr:hypothetical protein [Methylicorpusculum sp.]MDO8843527.1 hypothetical protein [Methylicorpusculum sp.]